MRISDWSSDVCSSDLGDLGELVGPGFLVDVAADRQGVGPGAEAAEIEADAVGRDRLAARQQLLDEDRLAAVDADQQPAQLAGLVAGRRSEERRVGKEGVRTCRSRWWAAP